MLAVFMIAFATRFLILHLILNMILILILILFLILILILILTEDRRRDRAASQGSDPLSAALPVCLTSVWMFYQPRNDHTDKIRVVALEVSSQEIEETQNWKLNFILITKATCGRLRIGCVSSLYYHGHAYYVYANKLLMSKSFVFLTSLVFFITMFVSQPLLSQHLSSTFF